MKQSRLVWEFMLTVIGEKYRLRDMSFGKIDLNTFFIAELFLICFKVNDETTQRELEKFFNKLPLHAEVQNEMFFRLKMACKLEVDDNE